RAVRCGPVHSRGVLSRKYPVGRAPVAGMDRVVSVSRDNSIRPDPIPQVGRIVTIEAFEAVGAAPRVGWGLETDTGTMFPRSALDVLVDLSDKVSSGRVSEYQPVPLGFTPLDKTIGLGIRPGELLLIGGAQGTGKTTMALQMARNVASGGQA